MNTDTQGSIKFLGECVLVCGCYQELDQILNKIYQLILKFTQEQQHKLHKTRYNKKDKELT